MSISTGRMAVTGLAMTLLCACSSTSQFSLPGNRFDLPQTLGDGQYRLAVENASATEVEMFDPDTSYPPRIDNPELTGRTGLKGLRVARGMSDRLELQLQTLPFMSDDANGFPGLKIKYRLSDMGGENASTTISRAVTAGIALWNKENRTYGNPAHYNDLQAVALDFAGIAAWRINDNWQLYGGPWVTWVQYAGQWRRESTGITDMKESYSGSASEIGLNLGLAWHLNRNWSLLGEVASSQLQWQDSDATLTHGGLQLRRVIY